MCVALYICKVGSYVIVFIILSWLVVVTLRKPKLVAQDPSSCHLEKLIFILQRLKSIDGHRNCHLSTSKIDFAILLIKIYQLHAFF